METTELDQALELLARYYNSRSPASGALPRLLQQLQSERQHELTDAELEWLAAAGTPPPFDPGKPH